MNFIRRYYLFLEYFSFIRRPRAGMLIRYNSHGVSQWRCTSGARFSVGRLGNTVRAN